MFNPTPPQAPDEAGAVEITQADRDRADHILRNIDALSDEEVARAFARHRLAGSPPPVVEEAGLRKALKRIVERAADLTPPDEWQARLDWIEAELDAEQGRPLFGDGTQPPCRNGHELSDLLEERAGLIARMALAAPPSSGEAEAVARMVAAAEMVERNAAANGVHDAGDLYTLVKVRVIRALFPKAYGVDHA